MSDLTVEQLTSLVAPYGHADIIQNTVTAFNQYAEQYEINTPLRKAHFLAQIAHESDHFKTTVEYGGSKKKYAPWYGRGLIQVTWEENYQDFQIWAQKAGLNPPDFTSEEGREEVAKFPWAFIGAVWFWDSRGLNALADADQVKKITRKINGGYNGLAQRQQFLTKAKKIFGITTDSAPEEGYSVEDVQKALVAAGMNIAVDGQMGPKTVAAVRMFQKINGLTPDGIIGPITAGKLGL